MAREKTLGLGVKELTFEGNWVLGRVGMNFNSWTLMDP